MRDGLWDIANNKEKIPTESAKDILKLLSRRDRALATIVLSVGPSLLYLIGDPDDTVGVWNKLTDVGKQTSFKTEVIFTTFERCRFSARAC